MSKEWNRVKLLDKDKRDLKVNSDAKFVWALQTNLWAKTIDRYEDAILLYEYEMKSQNEIEQKQNVL